MNALEIITSYEPKPIPFKGFDWIAIREDHEESGAMGYGATEDEAIADLLEWEEVLDGEYEE